MADGAKISGPTLARRATLVLTVIVALACLGIAIIVGGLGLMAGRYDEAPQGGLIFAASGGLPPFALACLLAANGVVLRQGAAGRIAKGVAAAAALTMGVCAVLALTNHVGGAFAFMFALIAALLASPLALRSPMAVKPRKS